MVQCYNGVSSPLGAANYGRNERQSVPVRAKEA